jgi:hypothetical protein
VTSRIHLGVSIPWADGRHSGPTAFRAAASADAFDAVLATLQDALPSEAYDELMAAIR